jgi:heme-degrading monooxygenase HmoA
MIERHWKGIAKRERAKEYVAHLQNDTFRQLATITGFISAKILERDVEEGTEFLIITEWLNIDAIKQFAGSDIEIAVVPELVHEMMHTYDKTVQHYKNNFDDGVV